MNFIRMTRTTYAYVIVKLVEENELVKRGLLTARLLPCASEIETRERSSVRKTCDGATSERASARTAPPRRRRFGCALSYI